MIDFRLRDACDALQEALDAYTDAFNNLQAYCSELVPDDRREDVENGTADMDDDMIWFLKQALEFVEECEAYCESAREAAFPAYKESVEILQVGDSEVDDVEIFLEEMNRPVSVLVSAMDTAKSGLPKLKQSSEDFVKLCGKYDLDIDSPIPAFEKKLNLASDYIEIASTHCM